MGWRGEEGRGEEVRGNRGGGIRGECRRLRECVLVSTLPGYIINGMYRHCCPNSHFRRLGSISIFSLLRGWGESRCKS